MNDTLGWLLFVGFGSLVAGLISGVAIGVWISSRAILRMIEDQDLAILNKDWLK